MRGWWYSPRGRIRPRFSKLPSSRLLLSRNVALAQPALPCAAIAGGSALVRLEWLLDALAFVVAR